MKGRREEKQASGGPVALTGNPGLRAAEARWLFRSVPVIEAHPDAALRKGAETRNDSHSSCHFLSHQSALTPTLHFAFKDALLFRSTLILSIQVPATPQTTFHLPQPVCPPGCKLHTSPSLPLLYCFPSSPPSHMPKTSPSC